MRSQYESYTNENGAPLTDDEIRRLLEANWRGGKWKQTGDTGSSKKWVLESGDVTATYDHKTGHVLKIETSLWDHYLASHTAEPEDGASGRLKDF